MERHEPKQKHPTEIEIEEELKYKLETNPECDIL